MSIEKALADLTAAVTANTEQMAGLHKVWTTLAAAAAAVKDPTDISAGGVPLTEKAAKGKEKPAATPAAPAPAPKPTPAAAAPAADSPSDIATRDDLLAAIKAKAKTHRDAVVSTLGKYGAAKGSEVKDEDVADCVADLNQIGAEEDLA